MKLFTKEIDKKLFDQYSKGNNLESQMVVAKIFNPYGRGTWYILNSDPEDSDYLWAIVDLFEVEIGSVLRSELESIKVPPFRLGLERDTSFRPINAKELYDGLMSGKHYEHGGSIEDENREMVLNDNNQIIHHTKELPSAIKGKRVPAWVVTKVHESASDLSDATHYMDGQKMAKGGSIKVGKDDFSFLLKLSDKELSKRLDLIRKQQVINGKQYLDAKNKGYNTTKIEESGKRLSNQENAIIQARLRNNKMEKGGGVYNPSKKEMLNYLNMYFDNYSELRTIAVEEDNILTRKMLNSLDDELLELAYEDAKYEIKADTQYAKGGGVEGVDLSKYEDIETLEYLYKLDNKWYASGFKMKHNAIGVGYTKAKALEDLDNHLSYVTTERYADGGEIDTNVEMIEDKDGSQYLFPKNSKNKTLGVKFANGGEIDSLNSPNSYLNIFTLGVKLPSQEKIISASMSPSHFSRKSLTLTLKGGSKEVIPEAKISDFLKGKQIDLRDTNGESYAIQLNKLNKKAKGGNVNKVAKVMHEFKEGNLHSGKSEKIVTNPKQAIAIALSEAKNNSEKKGWKHKK